MKSTHTLAVLATVIAMGAGSVEAQAGGLGSALGGGLSGAIGASTMRSAGTFSSSGNSGFDGDFATSHSLDGSQLRNAARTSAQDSVADTRSVAGGTKQRAGTAADAARQKATRAAGSNEASGDAGIAPGHVDLGGNLSHSSSSSNASSAGGTATSAPAPATSATAAPVPATPAQKQSQASASATGDAAGSVTRN